MIDVPLSAWFHAHTHPLFTQLMLAVSLVHGNLGICLMAAIAGGWLMHKHHPYWLLALVLSVPGGLVLNAAMKLVFRRARPAFDDPLVTLTTYSFPSGHTAGATVFYGFMAVLLLGHIRQRAWRAAIVAGAVFMVALVGLSRVYLGAHYLSDVVGAVVEGVFWLALCMTGVHALWRRRAGDTLHGTA